LFVPTAAGEQEWPHVSTKHLSQQSIVIRDVFPKHQEYVVNEMVGQETLSQQSSRTTTTKSWNVSGGASATLGGWLGINAAESASGTTTSETAEEKSQRTSRQTEVHNIYHLLTAYDVGGAQTTLEMQPRPFAQESWDLVQGFRSIEGLQDLLVVAGVPLKAKRLLVECQLTAGFRGSLSQHPHYDDPTGLGITAPIVPYWLPQMPLRPEAVNVQGGAPSAYLAQSVPLWDDFIKIWGSYQTSLDFYHSHFDIPIVLTTKLPASGWTQLYWGDDPCGDEPPPDLCDEMEEEPAEGHIQAGEDSGSKPVPARFVEHFVHASEGGADVASRIDAANRHSVAMFRSLKAASQQHDPEGIPLSDTMAWRGAVERHLEEMSLHPLADASLKSVLAELNKADRERASELSLHSFGDLAASGPAWRGRISRKDLRLRNKLVARVGKLLAAADHEAGLPENDGD